MYKRIKYNKKISPFINKPIIKIITGMRRIGKSTFFKQLIQEFMEEGVSNEQIIFINMESLQFAHIKNFIDLQSLVIERYKKLNIKKLYLFIDEVQEIEQWEKAVISFFSDDIADIYLTGSNAHLLSSELATLLSGRYVEIPIYPLTFKEYSLFRNSAPSLVLFKEYLRYGGFPGIHHSEINDEVVFQYISSVFDTIVLKDVVKRNNIRNVALLEKIIYFLIDNMASVFSARSVANFLKKEHRSPGVETVYNYIQNLEAAYLLHRVPRYDLKGKRFLETNEKIYLGEIGIRNALLGYKEDSINAVLENIIFLELKHRGYNVYIGRFQDREVDFIAEKENRKAYIQVCYLLASDQTVEREFSVLLNIPDNYPKFVLSMDEVWGNDYKGVKRMNIIDFLTSEDDLF